MVVIKKWFTRFWRLVFLVSIPLGIFLVALSMTDFGKTPRYHNFLGGVAIVFAIANAIEAWHYVPSIDPRQPPIRLSDFSLAGILVWIAVAALAFTAY